MPKLAVEAGPQFGSTRVLPPGVVFADKRPDGSPGYTVETVTGRIMNVEHGGYVLMDAEGRGQYPLPAEFVMPAADLAASRSVPGL